MDSTAALSIPVTLGSRLTDSHQLGLFSKVLGIEDTD